jgi:hypothetical protein
MKAYQIETVFVDGVWWAMTEIDGTVISAAGPTEDAAVEALMQKVKRIYAPMGESHGREICV